MELAEVLDTDLSESLALTRQGLVGLRAAVPGAIADEDLLAAQRHIEHLARQIGSLQIEAQAEIERRGLHRRDGHATARAMARHTLQLSDAEAGRRQTAVRALRDLPEVRAAFAHGDIGIDQVNLIASVHRNPRVRPALADQDQALAVTARRSSYRDLARDLRDWERLTDTDGAFTDNERNHENRDAKLVQDGIDLSWDLLGHFAAQQGAQLREIFDHYIDAEWRADWTDARARLGDTASVADLARTDAQRRADALARIFADAAGAPPGTRTPKIVHNIIWNAHTYFRLLDDLATQPTAHPWGPGPTTSGTGSTGRRWCDPATYRCETADGVPLDPVEAQASSLANHIRRVVINTHGVVIDLGTTTRLFTGSTRIAAKLQHPTCIWPGCQVPTTRCEVDHLHPHARGGGTTTHNGAPLCGFHNRWKQKGYTTQRSPDGTWHTYRPDGTEIT